jgi:hypothetical protein
MSKKVPIKLNVGSALQWLGKLYRSPSDAIKEHISNAIDEHLKAQHNGVARRICHVIFTLEKSKVIIEYPYGMDKKEFNSILQRVADSAKKTIDVAQIGRLGIGIFSFQQIGRKCTFFSKKSVNSETIRVTLKEGHDDAEFETALKRDTLNEPGIKIIISELKFDPTKPRGPLAVERLQKVFSEKFDGYLKKGWLNISINFGSRNFEVEPLKIDLPRVAKGLNTLYLPGQPNNIVSLDLYFDPSGKGSVAIRHMGVAVVENLKEVSAYGLEDSIYAGGFVRGFIDADFLEPLPARTGFDDNEEWESFIDLLDKHRPQIEAEVETFKQKEREKALTEIQKRAIELAGEILDLDEFKDLELLGGSRKSRQTEPRKPKPPEPEPPEPKRSKEQETPKEPGERQSKAGRKINYAERAFEEGTLRHSRFTGGIVEVNELNPDYKQERKGPQEGMLAYATFLIGKETIAYNYKESDDSLEKLLSFYFKLKTRISPNLPFPGKRTPGRPKKLFLQENKIGL